MIRICLASVLAALSLLPFSFAALAQNQIVVSEFMYHPVEEPGFNPDGTPMMDLYHDVHEFVELHNRGTSATSLAGWKLTGAVEYVFPVGTTIDADGYLVIARDKARLAAVPAYGLTESQLEGPYLGQLSNEGETLRLENAAGQVIDSVSYSSSFPWPISANALGAGEDWTGLKAIDYQYRGRSLERISFTSPADDPANWLASPLPGEPSPGRVNALSLNVPKPVVVQLHVAQAVDGQLVIRRNEPVRLECLFSSTNDLSQVAVEYFADNIQVTNKTVTALPMFQVGLARQGQFLADLPGQPDRTIVRYRIRADRGAGMETVSPRLDDPFSWHAYFVTPVRLSTNPVYDVFVSSNSFRILRTNISQNPRRYTSPDPPGKPRDSWNATQPAVFVHEGVVYDAQIRHHGSQFRREVSRRSYKVHFPRYRLFNRHSSMFLTDKDYQTEAGHALFRAVGLPTSLTRWIDLYMNNDQRLLRLEQEEYDEYMLERHHAERSLLQPEAPPEGSGEIFKAVGIFDPFGGPFGRAEGRPLPARTNRTATFWTPLQRYEWTYALQNHGWRGHTAFQQMLDGMWAARNGRNQAPTTNEIPKLRTYFLEHWDVDRTLTYLATINWMVPWDDTIHNYFVWQQRNGKWGMLPWDFDSEMDGQSSSSSILNGAPFAGPNFFKQSFIAAFQSEFKERIWWLNNTVLHPDNLASLRLHTRIRNWSTNRFRSVNTQASLGVFERPVKPVNIFPANGQALFPVSFLQSLPYAHSTNPAPAHWATTWMIRARESSYYAPIYLLTTTNHLTLLPLPSDLLEYDKVYFWKCIHTDVNGRPSLASAETQFKVGVSEDTAAGVILNEVMADNENAVSNGGRFPDWIELYNRTDNPQSIGGMGVTDDLSNPAKYVFPMGTVIQPRGYLMVWCDDATAAPGLHSGFRLSAEGQTVGLFASTPNGWVLQDVVTFGLQLVDSTVGRRADRPVEWALSVATPGRVNQAAPIGSPGSLKINEWLADPAVAEDDWFEICNPGTLPVDLGTVWFTDNLREPFKFRSPPLSFVPGGGFLRAVADGQVDRGAEHIGFRIDGSGGSLGIFSEHGEAIDTVSYRRQIAGISQGRVPDGSPAIYSLAPPSPGVSNATDSDLDGLPDAWEQANSLNPFAGADARLDWDEDGLTNSEEFLAGSDPRNHWSALKLDAIKAQNGAANGLILRFRAEPGKGYRVQACSDLETQAWETVAEVDAEATSRVVEVPTGSANPYGERFFRLVAY